MRRRTIALILLAVAAIWIGIAYLNPMLNPVHVDAARVERGTLYLTVRGTGQVTPKGLVPALAPAAAKVISVTVSLGQEVKKGDELAIVEVIAAQPEASPSAPPPVAPSQPRATSPTATPVTPTPRPESTRPPTAVPLPPASQTPTTPPAQVLPSPSPTLPPPPAQPTPSSTPFSPSTQQAPTPFSSPTQVSPSPTPSQPPTQPAPTSTPSPPLTQVAPSPTPSAAAPPPSPNPPPRSYTVQPGDTLSEIAQRYGTTVEEIARSNGVNNPDLIFPGQQLQIPQGRPPQGGFPSVPPAVGGKVAAAITSPVDGQVVKIEAKVGQTVAASTSLVTVADTSALFLEMLAGKEDLQDLAKGQTAQIIFDALPRETMRGKVEEIGPTPVTPAPGVSGYPVKVALEAPPKGLRLGMPGQAEVVTKQLPNVLFVPRRSVVEQVGEAYVFVVEDARVTKTPITLGKKARDYYEVRAGLSEGQSVVASNLAEMYDGLRVSIDKILGPK